MKARIKATGEIVEVTRIVDRYVMTHHPHAITFKKDELDFDIEDDPDYWTRLEHTYAGMAMQGILANIDLLMSLAQKKADDYPAKYTVAEFAKDCAHALVEKLKEKEERK